MTGLYWRRIGAVVVVGVFAAVAPLGSGAVASVDHASRSVVPLAANVLPACNADTADFPGDSCSVTAVTAHSVSMTWTTAPITTTYCTVNGPTPCIYQYFASFTISLGGSSTLNGDDHLSGSCPAAASNATFAFPATGSGESGAVGGSDDVGLANADPLVCSITFNWDPATQFPLDTALKMVEGDGQGDIIPPDYFHTFGATLPPPGPVAAFTATPDSGEPGAYTFTDKSYSLVPHVTIASEAWTADNADGDGPTWTHTFPKDGKYPVSLTVTDSNGNSSSVTKDVDVTTTGAGSSASIKVIEALTPASDSGRFDLYVGTKPVAKNTGDKGNGTAAVPAGNYLIRESAATTALDHYGVTLRCTRNGKHLLTSTSSADTVKVSAGDAVVCTFHDTRTKTLHCDVPKLIGKTLTTATTALRHANCRLGHVTRPKHVTKSTNLKVSANSPSEYAVRARNTKVTLTLTKVGKQPASS
jgi:PKD repeat protein